MDCLLIGVIISATITVINSMVCDGGWLEYEDKCLKHFSTNNSWKGANDSCFILRTALLATVDSPEINTFFHNNLTKGSDVWIGLSIPDISKPSWKWSDGGNTSSYNDWNNADVNYACATMKYVKSNRYWKTSPCSNEHFYICEKEMSSGNCSEWLSFDTHCYLGKGFPKTHMAAARNCWQEGAYLISINSPREADFVYSNITTEHKVYWIGLSPLKWVNDEPYQWNNWGVSGPSISDGCVYMNVTNGKWYSGDCDHTWGGLHTFICQKDANNYVPTTSNVHEEVVISTDTVLGESNTTEYETPSMSITQSSTGNSKQLLLKAVIPAVCGGLVALIVIMVVIIVIRRKKRSNGSDKGNLSQMNTTYVTNDKAVGGDNEDKGEHQGQEYCIYDEAEIVHADNGTIVVNGDVYAIVDTDKIQNHKVQDHMVSQQHAGVSPKSNQKQEIAQDQNHVIVGADVFGIVDKNNVKQNKQQKPKQKKKKPQTSHKLETTSNGLGHIVVGTGVYAIVDTEKVKPNKQQASKQKKKKPAAPPKLVDKAHAIDDGNVYYNEFDMKTATPTKHKSNGKKKTEDTGVVYADLDLTGSGSGGRPNGNTDEESGVVYADVRG